MICPYCSADNRPGASFCGSCGRPLGSGQLPVCVACNAALRLGARFCHRCGHEVVVAPVAAPVAADGGTGDAGSVAADATPPAGLVCATCGQANRTTARFCRACAAPLLVICDQCGRENRATAHFCRECGGALAGSLYLSPLSDVGPLPAANRPEEVASSGDPNSSTTRPPPRRSLPVECQSCGRTVYGGARFCPHCGQTPTARQQAVADKFTTGQMPPGQKLRGSDGAEYLILRLIARGGMGAVYEVGRPHDATRWAMKEMSETAFSRGDRAATVAKFQQEAELLRALRHENLPRVADVFEFNHRHYLVMELIEGRTLGELLDDHGGPLPEKDVVDWGAQLCRVLAFLHTRNPPIIYRDLKPDNVMVEEASGRVKLIDFGIARRFKGGKRSDTLMLGTRGYAAPEQFGKAESDARTDLFALGATLHHLLTHENPANRKPFEFTPLESYTHLKLSRRTCEALGAALQLAPEARPADAAALFKALTGRPMPPPPPATTPPVAIAPAAQGAASPLTGRLDPPVPLDLGTARRGETPSGSLPVAADGRDTAPLEVQPRAGWLSAAPERVTPGSDQVTVTAHTGRLALGRGRMPVNYRPRFVVDWLWWALLRLYTAHAESWIPAPRRHEGTVRVGQQDIAVAVTVRPTTARANAGRFMAITAVIVELVTLVLITMSLIWTL